MNDVAIALAQKRDICFDGEVGEAEGLQFGKIIGLATKQAAGLARFFGGSGDLSQAGVEVELGAFGVGLKLEFEVHLADEQDIDTVHGSNGAGV